MMDERDLPCGPWVWTDGTFVVDKNSGAAAGAWVYAHEARDMWIHKQCGHYDLLPPVPGVGTICL